MGHGPCAGLRALAGGGRSRAWPRLCLLSLLKLSKQSRSGQYWLGKKMGLSWWEAGIAPK